jgi:rubrerythrin
MQIEKMTIEDILGMAVATEIHGRKFYENLAEKVANPAVKSRIQGFANDEKRHQGIMENLYRTMLDKEPSALPARGVPDILKAIASLRVDNRTQVLQVLDMAIDAETTSAKFYQRGAVLASDQKTRRIFEELEKEEDGHFNYLVAEKASLSGDLYWFSISDSAMMEE